MGRRNEYCPKGGDAVQLGVKADMVLFDIPVLCDPYLSALEACTRKHTIQIHIYVALLYLLYTLLTETLVQDVSDNVNCFSVVCSKVKLLGESDDESDSAAAWVNRSRQLEQDRRLAEQRVRLVHNDSSITSNFYFVYHLLACSSQI